MFFSTLMIPAFAASAMAYYTANSSALPSGNAIALPGLNDLVPAGKTYTITWDPTTTGDISLVLLRGPSTNVVYLQTITDSVENTGSYDWAVPSDLEPDTTHYGIQLTTADGAYQYSTQFGISNDAYSGSDNSTSSASSTVASTVAAVTSSGYATSTGAAHLNSSSSANGSYTFATSTITSTAFGSSNTAGATTTGSSSAASTSTATGAAGKVGVSMAGLFVAAGVALMM